MSVVPLGAPRRPAASTVGRGRSGWTPTPAATGRLALTRRFPRGAVLGIAPFNFPLNLVAHKVAPAIAVGAPIILKPAPATPLSALLLGELLAETDLPGRLLDASCRCPTTGCPRWCRTRGCRSISFTGSDKVGYAIRDSVPRKHVHPGARRQRAPPSSSPTSAADADLDLGGHPHRAPSPTTRAASPASPCSGSSPTRPSTTALAEQIVAGRRRRRSPATRRDDATDVGPLIRRGRRASASSPGSTRPSPRARELLTGGERDGATYAPTVLADVPGRREVSCEEVFGPVLVAGQGRRRGRGVRARSTTPGTACRRASSPTTCRPAFRAAPRAGGRRRRHRRRAHLPRRPDAVRRGQGLRRRPRGRARRDGGPHLRAGPGAHRHRPLSTSLLADLPSRSARPWPGPVAPRRAAGPPPGAAVARGRGSGVVAGPVAGWSG